MYIKIIGIWNSTLNIFLLFLIFSCEQNTVNLDLDLYLKESVFYDKNTNLKFCNLGKRTLRSETAVLNMLSIINEIIS